MDMEQKHDCDRLCYVRDICRELGITSRTLSTWIAVGRFPAASSDLFGRRVWPASIT
jgi:hypothetical protein